MLIAVMSDLHDNLGDWQIIINELKKRQVETIINCGDTAAPSMLAEMSETFDGQIHTVFGNVADKITETQRAKELSNVTHYGETGELGVANRKIFFNHYPQIAKAKAATGQYDLCCYGHDHIKHAEKIGTTLLLNPGTAGGMFQYPSIAIVDLADMSHQFINLKL